MINPRVGDVWTIGELSPVEVVVTGVYDAALWLLPRRSSVRRVWRIRRKDGSIDNTLYDRGHFILCIKRAPKRKRLSPAAVAVLRDLVNRGDLSFHTTHQVARSLVKCGLAKWVITTETNFASLHATIEGFRLIDGGVDE